MSGGHGSNDAVLKGMGIEDVSSDGGNVRILTPGARVELRGDGRLSVHQRIGHERELLATELDSHFGPWRIEQATPFRVRLAGAGPLITVQGDSVLIFEPLQGVRLTFALSFAPAYNEEAMGNRLLLDQDGGCGFFGVPARPTILGENGPNGRSIDCHIGRWDELWVSVCPPRPEDSLRQSQSISHDILYDLYDDETMVERYPSADTIREIAEHCQILTVHEEVWRDAPDWVDDPPGANYDHPKPWETDRHLPYDEAEFARMRNEAHAHGLALVPYCSPLYCNAPDLYGEMQRVLDEYRVDGLYFDGWCGHREDFRPAYHMMRRMRSILGDRILDLHSSHEPYRTVRVYPPFVFAYADFVLRGEANRDGLPLEKFLRYAVSGRQISNAVGMWCHYGSMGKEGYHFVVPTTEDIQAARQNGVRIWRQTRMWRRYPEELARFDREYPKTRAGEAG